LNSLPVEVPKLASIPVSFKTDFTEKREISYHERLPARMEDLFPEDNFVELRDQ
jgi:hypothetical protein